MELHGLQKSFGDVQALREVSFSVEPGRITGFLGRNGAGKSTTMRSIFGLVNLDQGDVRWQGRPVDEEAMSGFGFMPEQRGLYRKMAIRSQVSWFAQLKGMDRTSADAAAGQLLEELGLGDRLGDKLEDLSHGNQQRVQLAASLAHDPVLAVLDEPFNGLDPSAVVVLNQRLRRLAERGKAVLFSSHQLDLIEDLCDEVVIIDEGRIMATGSVFDVRSRSNHHVLNLAYATAPDWTLLAREGVSAQGTRTGSIVLQGTERLHHLLKVADDAGSLSRFSFDLPSLSDVFQEVTA